MELTFLDTNQIQRHDLPKSFKKLTGTRFATVLGLNAWNTPFQAWCSITKVYEDPFTESKYTKAGQVIEPKVVQYMRDTYFMEVDAPEDVYGDDFFKTTYGNFFADKHKIFGGMWDGLGSNNDFVLEIKTTKRIEDWQHGAPEYYLLQVCLYAWLLGIDDVTITVSRLVESDYEHPEDYVPDHTNTQVFDYKISERYPTFEEDYIAKALDFWNTYVVTGISPAYDEKNKGDMEVIKHLRTEVLPPNDDEVKALVDEADDIEKEIESVLALIKPKEDRLKVIKGKIKEYLSEKITDDIDLVEIESDKNIYALKRTKKQSFDEKAFKEKSPKIHSKFLVEKEMLTLRVNAKKEEK